MLNRHRKNPVRNTVLVFGYGTQCIAYLVKNLMQWFTLFGLQDLQRVSYIAQRMPKIQSSTWTYLQYQRTPLCSNQRSDWMAQTETKTESGYLELYQQNHWWRWLKTALDTSLPPVNKPQHVLRKHTNEVIAHITSFNGLVNARQHLQLKHTRTAWWRLNASMVAKAGFLSRAAPGTSL